MGLLSTTKEWDDALAAWRGIQNAPAEENRRRLKGFKVLQNDFLEKYFVTSHWVMPAVWFVPIIAYCIYSAAANHGLSWPTIAGCFVIGVLTWTLLEYVLHRFVFHFPPVGPLRTLLFVMHGYHHEFPNDPNRLVAPPVLSWPIGALVALAYWALFGPYWQALLAGTFAGYIAYDWTHYYTHHAVPKSRFGKFMRRFHLEHHFKNATTQFGLSSPLWDFAFLSFRKPTMPTAMERECLGGELTSDPGAADYGAARRGGSESERANVG